ncbi:MAG: hypothetical protein AB7O97_09655 [Planctomycetota bacterium]
MPVPDPVRPAPALLARALLARVLPALALLPLAGCETRQPVDRDEWERQAQQLLEPLLGDVDVACGELLIEISPNYFGNVSQPAVDPNLHSVRKEHVDGWDETVWINRVGDLSGALRITIGEVDQITEQGLVPGRATRFTALHEVRLRVHAAGEIPVQLDVTATGQPLVWNPGGQMRELAAFRVQNGVLQAR